MSFNICSLNKDLIELLRPEAARLLQVDSAQLYVEFKQRLFDGNLGNEVIVNLKPFSKLGFLLDLKVLDHDQISLDYIFRSPLSNFDLNMTDQTVSNIFFNYFELDSADNLHFVFSYLEFRTK